MAIALAIGLSVVFVVAVVVLMLYAEESWCLACI